MPLRQTHTFVKMELSRSAYNEIARILRSAEYDHCFHDEEDLIDMSGIAVHPKPSTSQEVVLKLTSSGTNKVSCECEFNPPVDPESQDTCPVFNASYVMLKALTDCGANDEPDGRREGDNG